MIMVRDGKRKKKLRLSENIDNVSKYGLFKNGSIYPKIYSSQSEKIATFRCMSIKK